MNLFILLTLMHIIMYVSLSYNSSYKNKVNLIIKSFEFNNIASIKLNLF